MTILRRSIGLVTFLLSVLGLLLCMASIIGVWAGKGRVDAVGAALSGAAEAGFGLCW